MKFSIPFVFALAALQVGARAATTDTLPSCGLECIEEETLKSSCSLTNTTCICTNVELNEKISLCVHTNCTVRQSLAVQRYSKHTCGAPSRNRTALVWIVGVVFLVLGLLGFGLRVAARLCLGNQNWGAEDWVMVAAVGMMVALNALSIPISRVALGKDIWNVHPDDINMFLYIFFWDELLYLGALPLTKISILLFYLKIFPHRNTRVACWILIALNAAYFIVFELVSIFQCKPIEGAWRAWDEEFPAKCNNINMQGWMAAALNILLDLCTLIVPLPDVYRLSLSLRKKIQIMLMFGIGFFVTIVSIIRLQSLASYATTSNVTQDYVEVGYWSTIEVPVGIICACMPAIRTLFSRIFPKVFGSTNRAKSSYANISSQSKQGVKAGNSSIVSSKPITPAETDAAVLSRSRDDSSCVELTNMTYDDHEGRRSLEKKPATPREPV